MLTESASVATRHFVLASSGWVTQYAVPISIAASVLVWLAIKRTARRRDKWELWTNASIVASASAMILYTGLAWPAVGALRLSMFAAFFGIGLQLGWVVTEGLLEDEGVLESPDHVPSIGEQLQGAKIHS